MAEQKPDELKSVLFLYSDAMEEISNRSKQGPLVICGGRGIGKSEVARRLRQDWALEEKSMIRGMDHSKARELIIDYAKLHRGGTRLIIDDLDRVIQTLPGDTAANTIDLVRALTRLFASAPSGHNGETGSSSGMVATSSINFRGTRALGRLTADVDQAYGSKVATAFSEFILIPIVLTLNPWTGDWEHRLEQSFEQAFQKQLGPRLTKAWLELVHSLTGGHPALIGPIADHIQALLGDLDDGDIDDADRCLVDSDKYGSEANDLIRLCIEDLLVHTGMPAIRGAVRRLKQSDDPDEVEAYHMLIALADERRVEDIFRPGKADIISRSILIEDGLLYQDRAKGSYEVPGVIIRNHIQSIARFDPIASLKIEPGLKEDAAAPEDAGDLLYGDRVIHFRGQSWRVLRKLYKNRGQFIKLGELDGGRNAVQRLREELKDNGLEQLVENVYRRGYRFI